MHFYQHRGTMGFQLLKQHQLFWPRTDPSDIHFELYENVNGNLDLIAISKSDEVIIIECLYNKYKSLF